MLDKETVRRMAFLSKIDMDDDIDSLKEYFEDLLSQVSEIENVDTQGLEPMVNVNISNLVLRKDNVTEGGDIEAVLSNAPNKEFGYFVVPKVME